MNEEIYTSPPDMRKAAVVVIKDRKLLVSRSKGKDVFVAPGGKLEEGETPLQAGVREMREEQGLELSEEQLEHLGTFRAIAAGHEDTRTVLDMDVFVATGDVANPQPQAEIEENRYITSKDVDTLKLGSIFEHDVIPRLVERDLID